MKKVEKVKMWTVEPGAEEISLILVGDTNIQNREIPESAFTLVLETLNGADVVFGQMEGPLSPPSTDPENPDIPHKLLWRHSDPAMVQGYKAANFKAVACASNVCFPPRAALNSIREIVGIPSLLTAFVVKAITGGTDAQGVVSISIEWEGIRATERGSHTDIVIASAYAFVNALNRMDLLKLSHNQLEESEEMSGI